jgi:hypothetical protein
VKRQAGKLGQFDVVVDGKVVASRTGNAFTKLLGGGWPDPEAVIAKIEELQRSREPG